MGVFGVEGLGYLSKLWCFFFGFCKIVRPLIYGVCKKRNHNVDNLPPSGIKE